VNELPENSSKASIFVLFPTRTLGGKVWELGQTVDCMAASEKLRLVNRDSRCGRVTDHAIVLHSSSEHSLAIDWWS
jgi:hypothetical protein